MDPRYSTGI